MDSRSSWRYIGKILMYPLEDDIIGVSLLCSPKLHKSNGEKFRLDFYFHKKLDQERLLKTMPRKREREKGTQFFDWSKTRSWGRITLHHWRRHLRRCLWKKKRYQGKISEISWSSASKRHQMMIDCSEKDMKKYVLLTKKSSPSMSTKDSIFTQNITSLSTSCWEQEKCTLQSREKVHAVAGNGAHLCF